MSEPLPADRSLRAVKASAETRRARAVGVVAAPVIARTWLPTSLAVCAQEIQAAATRSRAVSSRRSLPAASSCSSGIAIEESSVHSPGAQSKGPPPSMTITVDGGSAGPNS